MTNSFMPLSGPHCSVDIHRASGTMVPRDFSLGRRKVSPFCVAPWADEPAEKLAKLPPLLRQMRGEWPCVPFGATKIPDGLPEDWRAGQSAIPGWHRADHGHGSNTDWSVVAQSEYSVKMSVDYPGDHPVKRLERRVSVDMDEPGVTTELKILPRMDVVMPIGLHPVLRLPETPGAARLALPDDARAWTFPVESEPSKSMFLPDQRDRPLHMLRLKDAAIDPTRLPWDAQTEDLVLLTGTGGFVQLQNLEEGYAVSLNWDAEALPSCMLWISNRGRAHYPWNARFRAIGIEPVCAPFDLGPAFTGPDTPLAQRGISTGVRLEAGRAWSTRMTIVVGAL